MLFTLSMAVSTLKGHYLPMLYCCVLHYTNAILLCASLLTNAIHYLPMSYCCVLHIAYQCYTDVLTIAYQYCQCNWKWFYDWLSRLKNIKYKLTLFDIQEGFLARRSFFLSFCFCRSIRSIINDLFIDQFGVRGSKDIPPNLWI